ncbi:MAG: hypothetical protein AAF449_03055 [Myxococcota bacterium]
MNGVNGTGNNSLEALRLRTLNARDDMSSKSQNFRDAMEAMHKMAMDLAGMVMGIVQTLAKVFGAVSG